SISISMAWLISGRASGGNSTSTTGPAMATTRPSFSSVPARSSAVMVIGSTPLLSLGSLCGHADAEILAERLFRALSAVAEGLGGALVLVANDLALGRHQRADDDLLAAHRDEARVDDLDHVDAPVEERVAHGGGDAAGVLVRRLVAETGERGLHREAAVAEVALPLAADHVDRRVAPHFAMLRDL